MIIGNNPNAEARHGFGRGNICATLAIIDRHVKAIGRWAELGILKAMVGFKAFRQLSHFREKRGNQEIRRNALIGAAVRRPARGSNGDPGPAFVGVDRL